MKNKIYVQNGQAPFDSTLLIPEKLQPFFDVKVNEFGSVCKLFMFVANAKHPVFNYRPRPGTGKTNYAPDGQNLQKVNFRPREEDWERFRVIAQSRRISMSFLFVLALMFWNLFAENDLVAPVIPEKISLLVCLTFGPLFTRIRLCRHRI